MNWLHFFYFRAAPRPPLHPIESDRMELAALSHEDASRQLIATIRSAVDHSTRAVEDPDEKRTKRDSP